METTYSLKAEAYTSKEWFDREMELIFENSWQYAGLVEDIQNPGDYITVQCGRFNIMVLMGKEGELRAFHNLCRHRGTQLLRAVGKRQKVITCPYHDWMYDLSGELISVPEKEKEFPNMDMGKMCLHKASVGVWRGMIWVHPVAGKNDLKAYLDPVLPYLGPHNPERLIEYPDTSSEDIIQANWKIVVENYMDVYHLSHLHSTTLNMYDHANSEFSFVGEHYVFYEPLAKKYEKHLADLIPVKRIAEMTDEYLGAYVPYLFPSVGLSETESSWSVFQVIPLALDKTKVVVRTKLEPMSSLEYTQQEKRSNSNWAKIMGSPQKYDDTIPNDPMTSGDFMKEDIFACEQQQKGMQNPLFKFEHTALRAESSIRGFQDVVANRMKV